MHAMVCHDHFILTLNPDLHVVLNKEAVEVARCDAIGDAVEVCKAGRFGRPNPSLSKPVRGRRAEPDKAEE